MLIFHSAGWVCDYGLLFTIPTVLILIAMQTAAAFILKNEFKKILYNSVFLLLLICAGSVPFIFYTFWGESSFEYPGLIVIITFEVTILLQIIFYRQHKKIEI